VEFVRRKSMYLSNTRRVRWPTTSKRAHAAPICCSVWFGHPCA
jgi:hypothetical protein